MHVSGELNSYETFYKLEFVSEFIDLGILFDPKLTFNKRINMC